MSDTPKKESIVVKDKDGKVMGWVDVDEWNLRKAFDQNLEEVWFRKVFYGIPESKEDQYLQRITGVITKERGLVFWNAEGKFYEPMEDAPALKIPLVEIKEKLTVIRGATGFDF